MSLLKRLFSTAQSRPRATHEVGQATLDTIRMHLAAEDSQAAFAILEPALEEYPQDGRLLLLKARALRQTGRIDAALNACDSALAGDIDPASVHLEIAHCRVAEPDLPGAVEALHVALELDKHLGAAWVLLGQVMQRIDDHVTAQQALVHATTCLDDPLEQAQAWLLLGRSRMATLDIGGARSAFEQSFALGEQGADIYMALGIADLWMDDEPAAVLNFEAAMAKIAVPSRQLKLNLAYALQHSGHIEEARSMYAKVLSEDPTDHTTRWFLCQLDLLLCHWEDGWRNYASRFTSGATAYRPIGYKPWDGCTRSADTLLVLADEGLGDEIMYAACVPQAAARMGQVIVECEPRLAGLFARSFPGVHVVPTTRSNQPGWLDGLPTPDWQLPAGALPGLFRLKDEDFPHHEGYLKADPVRVERWRERLARDLGPGLKVGISWRGGTLKTRQRARSLDAQTWRPILAVEQVHWVNLQYGDYGTELRALETEHSRRIHDYPAALQDYEETAALVSALDLVVSVCTAVVHLAGSLGKPVWVLAPLVPGWRYTASRDVMPWYPTSQIFRQQRWGEWDLPCRNLALRLAELTKTVACSPTKDVNLRQDG